MGRGRTDYWLSGAGAVLVATALAWGASNRISSTPEVAPSRITAAPPSLEVVAGDAVCRAPDVLDELDAAIAAPICLEEFAPIGVAR